ncbi:MAG: MFS transporter, partial [Mycobacterium sp.]|nr:MFS transporter [Mycobacterium sp.]
LKQEAARRGMAPTPSAMPRRALAPDFTNNVLHDVSHAYTAVFVVAVVLAYVPAAFLPKKRVATEPGRSPLLTH